MVNDPVPGTADFTNTLAFCCDVASTMLDVVTPSVIVLEVVPAGIVVIPLLENFALPVTDRAVPPPPDPAAVTPTPLEVLALPMTPFAPSPMTPVPSALKPSTSILVPFPCRPLKPHAARPLVAV